MPINQDNLKLKLSTPLGPTALAADQVRAEMGLSQLYTIHVMAWSEDPELDMSAVLGQHVTLTQVGNDEAEFFLGGLCTRMSQGITTDKRTLYDLELRPAFWTLTLLQDARIFQEKDTPTIIGEVLDAAGVTDYELSLEGSYTKRPFCVQYQETSYNFLCRLMEEDGIFFFFKHADGASTLVIADAASAHVDRSPALSMPCSPPHLDEQDKEMAFEVELIHQVTAVGYAMGDYNFTLPSTDLKVKVGEATPKDIFEYPGRYEAKADGEARVKTRIEAMELPAQRISGTARADGLVPGLKFALEAHPRGDINATYVAEIIRLKADQTGHAVCEFVGFPEATPYRPPLKAIQPVINGSQTALVVGPSGEEIHTDEHGRVKVQFHWDRVGKKDDKSSCFIRVAQGWAGKSWGMVFLPRIGQEVVVTFLDGNPDRPLITGSVYNADIPPPYKLPGEATKSTIKSESSKGGGGFNELRFEDKKDSEEIYIHAQKDMNVEVLNDATTTITNNETHTVEGERTVKVTKAETVTHEDTHTWSVTGDRELKVEGAETRTNSGDVTWEIAGNLTLTIDGDLTIEAGGAVAIVAGSTLDTESGTDMTHVAGTSATVEGGTELNLTAGTTLTAEGGVDFALTGSASGEIDGGGSLTVSGGMVEIN